MSKVQNALTGTGLNLNFTTKGVTGSFGSGSDIGLMAGLASLYKGLSTRDWAAKTYGANSDTYQSVGKVYTYGDSAALATIARLRKGVDELKVGTSGGTIGAQTTASEDGKRLITINGYGNADSLAVALSHEAHRDGYSPDWGSFTDPDSDEFKQAYGDQAGETYRAVLAHTQLARKLAKDGGAGIFADQIGIQTDLAKLKRAEEVGMAAFAEYVGRAYDSTKDYWKLTDNGLEFDGHASIVDEDGNVIVSFREMGLQNDDDVIGGLGFALDMDYETQADRNAIAEHMVNILGFTVNTKAPNYSATNPSTWSFTTGNAAAANLAANSIGMDSIGNVAKEIFGHYEDWDAHKSIQVHFGTGIRIDGVKSENAFHHYRLMIPFYEESPAAGQIAESGSLASWIDEYITQVSFMGQSLSVHKDVKPKFEETQAALIAAGVTEGDLVWDGGSAAFVPRLSGNGNLSNHAFGGTFDINVSGNPHIFKSDADLTSLLRFASGGTSVYSGLNAVSLSVVSQNLQRLASSDYRVGLIAEMAEKREILARAESALASAIDPGWVSIFGSQVKQYSAELQLYESIQGLIGVPDKFEAKPVFKYVQSGVMNQNLHFVDVMKQNGAVWGGDWGPSGSLDFMHFEFTIPW